jgi:hypothetical protein
MGTQWHLTANQIKFKVSLGLNLSSDLLLLLRVLGYVCNQKCLLVSFWFSLGEAISNWAWYFHFVKK